MHLGVAETIVHTWLPMLIERVNVDYPNLELEVDITPNQHDRPPETLISLSSSDRSVTRTCTVARFVLTFAISWPSAPGSFAAQKAAEIATDVAKASAVLARFQLIHLIEFHFRMRLDYMAFECS